MKLLLCDSCGDVFNLDRRLKTCTCGKTKGMYVNSRDAEVNGQGISLAIGNGSLDRAIIESIRDPSAADFREGGDPWKRHPTSIVAWVRPHEGPANPHTRVNKEL